MLAAGAGNASAQSALDAPANLAHGWIGESGVVQFNLLHRFSLGPAPSRKLTNAPTLALSTALAPWASVGFNYATNSDLVPGYPNEWEFFARVMPVRQEKGAPLDITLQVGHNRAAESQDASVLVGRRLGRLRLLATGSVFSHAFDSSARRYAVGGGGVYRLTEHVALAADLSALTRRVGGERSAWSTSVQLAIPYTPHSLSLHATNVNARTLEGIARGGPTTRYGFEYTIPITLKRYWPSAPAEARAFRVVGAGMGAAARMRRGWALRLPARRTPPPDTVHVDLRQFAVKRPSLQVTQGTTVVWHNRDPLVHTVVTDVSGGFSSGTIAPGKSWAHTFTAAGKYAYHCEPHPFMKGTVVVR